MTTHTPGPWRIDEQYAPELGRMAPTPYITDAHGQHVAAALLMVPEQEANARLIAAAPALLAALDDGAHTVEAFLLGAIPAEHRSEELQRIVRTARAALRAATGDPS